MIFGGGVVRIVMILIDFARLYTLYVHTVYNMMVYNAWLKKYKKKRARGREC